MQESIRSLPASHTRTRESLTLSSLFNRNVPKSANKNQSSFIWKMSACDPRLILDASRAILPAWCYNLRSF